MTASLAKRVLVVLLATMAVAGCAAHRPYRGDPVESKGLENFLSFLRESGVSRATVESRLGQPRSTFEGGKVVAYRLWEDSVQTAKGWDPRTADYTITYVTSCSFRPMGGCEKWMIQLMIEYSDDAKVVRYSTLSIR